MFDDDSSQPQLHMHSYKDLQQTTTNDYTLNVQGKTTTTVEKGDYLQTVSGKVIINAKKAVHIVNGESRISITPSDIMGTLPKINYPYLKILMNLYQNMAMMKSLILKH